MLRRIFVFLICVIFEILLQGRKSTSILILACTTFEKMISFESFEYSEKVHQKQQISNSLERDRKQPFLILNILIIVAVCVAVVSVQTSGKYWLAEFNIKDDLYMSWSRDRSISKLPLFREFASIPVQKCWALPFSLGQYLNKSKKGNKVEFMNYEWGRYESFKDFPLDSPARPMRLASNGFYYTGTKDTVECFSCKLKYSDWKEGDEPDALHKFLSPDCNFIKGFDSTNVPIHSTSESISNGSEYSTEGAVGGASYTIESHEKSSSSNFQVQHQPRQSHVINDAMSSRHIKHKFPDYENSQHRMDSFSNWPCADVIASRVLVEAGFFYAGFSDCVRCFSCGGGLRNWEYGDGPWEEHARWFHECKFLIEQKGLEFVRRYQETHTDSVDELPAEAIMSGDEALRTLGGNRKQHEAESNTCTINEKEGERKIVCDVKGRLNEMGFLYSFHHIRNAIHRLKCNGDQISTESVITHLIDNSEECPEQVERNNSEGTNILQQEPVFANSIRSNKEAENKTRHNAKSSGDISSDISNALTVADPGTLQEENTKLQNQLLCKICMDSDSNVVFIPCGHMVSCEKCAPHIRKCAVCRVPIKGRVKAFMT
ncbi:baculoviral IAP repeat-containing protein 3-like [Mercenaria mercenaria]|uniref:baculoviral IAP repeat-containing protein 3-like n=1 Tax=Mercenaria mercenaria TaxID=6596 RepID=UPI00234EB7D5|nr:baculoviral IAP repeat-containing protein 3-like [Mercenaria mercenaria]